MSAAAERFAGATGKAANRVSKDGRTRYPDIPWQDIITTSNRIIHGYDTVDYDIVWRIIIEELPVLIAALERALPGPHELMAATIDQLIIFSPKVLAFFCRGPDRGQAASTAGRIVPVTRARISSIRPRSSRRNSSTTWRTPARLYSPRRSTTAC